MVPIEPGAAQYRRTTGGRRHLKTENPRQPCDRRGLNMRSTLASFLLGEARLQNSSDKRQNGSEQEYRRLLRHSAHGDPRGENLKLQGTFGGSGLQKGQSLAAMGSIGDQPYNCGSMTYRLMWRNSSDSGLGALHVGPLQSEVAQVSKTGRLECEGHR